MFVIYMHLCDFYTPNCVHWFNDIKNYFWLF